MRYGVREICDVVFKAKKQIVMGGIPFPAGAPVFYIDTAKTSTLEGAGTTVYATGGKGNTRLLTWEGEKTLTFTVEDALMSPISFAMLSGAGLIKTNKDTLAKVHKMERATVSGGKVTVDHTVASGVPVYVMPIDKDGVPTGAPQSVTNASGTTITVPDGITGQVFIDYYTTKYTTVSEIQISPEFLSNYYYVEASTLFKRQNDGYDAPVEITIPKVKIQSNFTFSMAATGDPSTFTFTMDAMPDFTYFNRDKKVLCAMQIIEDQGTEDEETLTSVFTGEYSASETTNSNTTSVPDPVIEISSTGQATVKNTASYNTVEYKVGDTAYAPYKEPVNLNNGETITVKGTKDGVSKEASATYTAAE